MSDVDAVDASCSQFLESVRSGMTTKGVTEETFDQFIFETFSVRDSCGYEVELVKNGKSKQVTWSNRNEFAKRAEHLWLHQWDEQMKCVISGLSTIVPIDALQLFTWEELELRVCGDRYGTCDMQLFRMEYF